MDNKNAAAIMYINKLNIVLNKSENISVIYLFQLYLKLLTIVSLSLKDYTISNEISNLLTILSIRVKYILLKEETKHVSFVYKESPSLSKQVIGVLNKKYALLFVKWINFYRNMFNLPKVRLNTQYCKDVQCGVDILTLLSKGIHHGFSSFNKPDLINKDDWTTGSRATTASIISHISTNPEVLIFKYLSNSISNDTHSREWLLDKGLQEIGVGQTKSYNGLLIMTMSDLNNKKGYSNPIISFPNHGVFPFRNVQNGEWGLYLPNPPYSKDLYTDIQRNGLNIRVYDNTDNKFMPVSNISIENLLNYGYYIGISYSVYNTKVNHNYSITIKGIPCIGKYSYNVTLFNLL